MNIPRIRPDGNNPQPAAVKRDTGSLGPGLTQLGSSYVSQEKTDLELLLQDDYTDTCSSDVWSRHSVESVRSHAELVRNQRSVTALAGTSRRTRYLLASGKEA